MTTLHTIGLMSGSSLDGLDIACCEFIFEEKQLQSWHLIEAQTMALPPHWKRTLRALPDASALDLATAHAAFGNWLGEQVNAFLDEHPHIRSRLDAIASHGHTIFHEPEKGFTCQIGEGAAIAARSGFPAVCDFRTLDVALGGQGAPLAPIADKLLFPDYALFLNLGGIANISARRADGSMIAFDVTGCNQVLDALAQLLGLPYDKNGSLARGGQIDSKLLEQLDNDTYFSRQYPKSLSNQWVASRLVATALRNERPVIDRLHTVCIHIGQQVAASLDAIAQREELPPGPMRMLISGGGAFNTFLVECLKASLAKVMPVEIVVPAVEIVKFKEAILMALMGALRLANLPNTLASVTGARCDTCSGAIYLP